MRYEIAGKVLICQHCECDNFTTSSVQLNTAMMSLLELDWLNASAQVFGCRDCGRLEWFNDQANVVELDDLSKTDCLVCDGHILAGQTMCNKCGWTYLENERD